MDERPNRLREFRDQRGMSLQQMADYIGCTKSQAHRLETGDNELTVKWMRIIGRKFGIKPSELMNDEDVEFRATAEDHQLRESLKEFSSEERALVLRASTDIVRLVRRMAPKRKTVALDGDDFQVGQLADAWNELSPDRREDALSFLRAASQLSATRLAAE
jgi:transcriptional regulator with XRE-family HTH domain